MKLDQTTKIQEVIVVEGKDDTKRIKAAVNADTLETRGSALSDETLEQIEQLNETRGVIVFTDPDFSGEKIRRQITDAVPDVKQAFINKADAVPKNHHGSLGVEHATPEAIRQALAHVYTPSTSAPVVIDRKLLLAHGLISGTLAKQRRRLLGEYLNIGYVNGKQLAKRLQLFEISEEEFLAACAHVDDQLGKEE